MTYDVVVVGAGTAGAFAAYTLAKKGFKVALVDRKPADKIGEKVCGDAIGKHHFVTTGLEPPKLGFDAESLFEGVRVFSPDKRNYITAFGEGYALNRRVFGQRILKSALDEGAVLYDRCHAFKSLVEESWVKGVRVRDLKSGETRDLQAKIVMDASGATAVIRNTLPEGWWVSEKISRRDYIVAYREIVELEEEVNSRFADIFLDVEVAPGGYWWFFPKSKNVVNIGIGVQQGANAPNPKTRYIRHVLPIIKKKGIVRTINSGGGIVPVRRTVSCMVWNGFIVVGDAACTANPIHGGGIGPSLLSALNASRTIEEAFEAGSPTLKNLWSYHHKYHSLYGAKQAALDILRIYLQKLTNDDLNFILDSKIVSDEELSSIGYEGELEMSILKKLNIALRLARRPTILREVKTVKDYMDRVKGLYLEFPRKPEEFLKWRNYVNSLFTEFEGWLERVRA